MSTRRSVRMGGAAAAAAAAGGANKSGVVAATAPAVAVAAGGTTRSVPHAQSEDRRKTRSAVIETRSGGGSRDIK
uniref:Putative secreted protein n=1 Tax=Xenopsylla cheopis TaxID=163159 RepID=A0A6M2DY06_XENCH